MISSNLLLFSFLQPRVWAWLVQGSHSGRDHPHPSIHTILGSVRKKTITAASPTVALSRAL